MASISHFERDAVERRIDMLRQLVYRVSLEELPATKRAEKLRSLLGEIRQLLEKLGVQDVPPEGARS